MDNKIGNVNIERMNEIKIFKSGSNLLIKRVNQIAKIKMNIRKIILQISQNKLHLPI